MLDLSSFVSIDPKQNWSLEFFLCSFSIMPITLTVFFNKVSLLCSFVLQLIEFSNQKCSHSHWPWALAWYKKASPCTLFLTSVLTMEAKSVLVILPVLLGLGLAHNSQPVESALKRQLLASYDKDVKPSGQVTVRFGMWLNDLELCPHKGVRKRFFKC